MSEQNKQLSEALDKALDGLPENVVVGMIKEWTAEARGAKKVCDIAKAAEE